MHTFISSQETKTHNKTKATPLPQAYTAKSCHGGTADKQSGNVTIQGLRNEWVIDEASDFAKNYSLYHSQSLPLAGNRCFKPHPLCSCSSRLPELPVCLQGWHLPRAVPFWRSLCLKSWSKFSYIMLLIPVGRLKKNKTN